jgi:hypothetical protein
MQKIFYLLFITLLLTSCSTGYHSSGMLGGYQEKFLSSDTAMVSFQGNGLTSVEKTYSYAMKRAAEVTLQRGYTYFEVLNYRNYYVPNTSTTTAGTFTSEFPNSEIKIKFVRVKTAKAYDANKVFSQVES